MGLLTPSSCAADVIFPPCLLSAVSTNSLSTFSRASFNVRALSTPEGSAEFEVAGCDTLSFGHDGRTLDSVLKFPDVSGPSVAHEAPQCVGRKGETPFAVLDTVLSQELRGDERTTSSSRWRSAGRLTTNTARRKSKSSRNLPLATASCRLRLVAAAITRASLWISRRPPTR